MRAPEVMKILHPIGNLKIFLIKNFRNILSKTILFFLSLILKIDTRVNEIIISTAFYAPWKEDGAFFDFYNKVKKFTLLDPMRAYTLWYFTKDLKNENANILDIGCMQGGAGFILSKINNKGFTYLIDTFEGFVEEEKYHKKKHFIYKEIDMVKKKIKVLKLRKTKVYKKNFPYNLGKSFNKKRFKVCHIDVNTYKSTKNTFNYIKNKMIKGGVIIFDDYGIYSTDGIKKFIKEISNKQTKNYTFVYNFMGQCILIKK